MDILMMFSSFSPLTMELDSRREITPLTSHREARRVGGLVEHFLFKHKVTMLSLFSDLWVTYTHTPIQTGI